ncbi:hypothetical protein ACFSL4_11155 [Streptomyces caeni]|uniref:Uncharacterized protein n=1 Tax=Streptomyces caeni TaxID=2307231 RepID=A0ABW4IN45_9ACTN
MSKFEEAGAVTRKIPESPKSAKFQGYEFHIPHRPSTSSIGSGRPAASKYHPDDITQPDVMGYLRRNESQFFHPGTYDAIELADTIATEAPRMSAMRPHEPVCGSCGRIGVATPAPDSH